MYGNDSGLRIEIAILQEELDAFVPKTAKFRIPCLMTENIVSNYSTSGANIVNRRNGNLGASTVSVNNTVELYVPYEFTFAYGDRTIPKDTKFIIAFIGANINDAKVIGRYNESKNATISTNLSEYIKEIILLDKRLQEVIIHSDQEDNKIREYLDLQLIEVGESITNLSNTLSGDISSAVSAAKADITRDINNLRTSLETKITTDITAAKTATETKMASDIAAAVSGVNNTIASTKTELQNTINSTKEALELSDTSIRADLGLRCDTIEDTITTNANTVTALANSVSTRFDEVWEDLQSKDEEDTAIRELITTKEIELKQYSDTKKDEAKAYTDSEITSLAETVDTNMRQHVADQTAATLNTAKSYTDTQVSTAKTQLYTDITTGDDTVRREFTAADAILSGRIDAIPASISGATNELKEELKEADKQIIQQINTVNTTITQRITEEHNSAKQYTDELVGNLDQILSQSIEAEKEERKRQDGVLEDTFEDKLAQQEADIGDTIQAVIDSVNRQSQEFNTSLLATKEVLDKSIQDTATASRKYTDTVTQALAKQMTDGDARTALEAQERVEALELTLTNRINEDVDQLQGEIEGIAADLTHQVEEVKKYIDDKVAASQALLDGKIEALRKEMENNFLVMEETLQTDFDWLLARLNKYKAHNDALFKAIHDAYNVHEHVMGYDMYGNPYYTYEHNRYLLNLTSTINEVIP